jgi:hypothetical protein
MAIVRRRTENSVSGEGLPTSLRALLEEELQGRLIESPEVVIPPRSAIDDDRDERRKNL